MSGREHPEVVWPRKRYDDLYRRSLEDTEGFWAEQAKQLECRRRPFAAQRLPCVRQIAGL